MEKVIKMIAMMWKPDDKDEDEGGDNGPEDKDAGEGGGRPAGEEECDHFGIFKYFLRTFNIKQLFSITKWR